MLVLDAAYEATLYAALECNCTKVVLTAVGGGVFANKPEWIADAIMRAHGKFKSSGLNVTFAYYGANVDADRKSDNVSARASARLFDLLDPKPAAT